VKVYDDRDEEARFYVHSEAQRMFVSSVSIAYAVKRELRSQ
jgi:hypothetical protein